MTTPSDPNPAPDWALAPAGWNWCAQDADGRWYGYRTEPVAGIGGGVWRSHSRNQQYAGDGLPNPDWFDSLRLRPGPAHPPDTAAS